MTTETEIGVMQAPPPEPGIGDETSSNLCSPAPTPHREGEGLPCTWTGAHPPEGGAAVGVWRPHQEGAEATAVLNIPPTAPSIVSRSLGSSPRSHCTPQLS